MTNMSKFIIILLYINTWSISNFDVDLNKNIHLLGPRGEDCGICPQPRDGIKGNQGVIGFKGYKGHSGVSGVQGPTGFKGKTGKYGRNGQNGVKVLFYLLS